MRTTQFYQTDVYRVIEAMKATGNRSGMVRQWHDLAETLTSRTGGSEDVALRAWLPYWKVRPFYTVKELCPLFPVLAVLFGFTQRAAPQMSTNRLANLLDFGGLPKLRGVFRHPFTGQMDNFYIVERLHYWRNCDMTQEEFEAEFEL